MEVVKSDHVFEIPTEVAVCPVCGGKLYGQCDCWIEEEDGWKIESINLDCEHEPEIDSDEWNEWFKGHYAHPYIDWLPVNIMVVKWVNENFSFDLAEANP